jgi:DNA repair protein RecO (recombination protein O)
MICQDKGFLLSINKYNENSAITDFYTENYGKITGVIFGSTSKKLKVIY